MKSVIELVKTAQGYSIVQDGHQVNKITNRVSKQKPFNAVPKKFSQQTFTIYPYIYSQEGQYNQKYIIIPAKSQWFNLNQIHQIQKKALPQWFKTKKVVFGAVKPDKFEKNQELYKRYRNHIIDLAKNQYLSPTKARKGLAGDVCAILRIHSFLQKNGLINYVFPKTALNNNNQPPSTQEIQNKLILARRKDCVDKDKSIFQKHFDKDHLELLKKITIKFRPICHLCEGICGVLWYQYEEELYLKTFEQMPKRNQIQESRNNNALPEQRKGEDDRDQNEQNKKRTIINKSSKPFKYMLRLCSSCFTAGNIPVVLSIDSFKKCSVLQNQVYEYEEPRDKKKINEQNRFIEFIQKNKFNLRKTAEALKITEENLYNLLLCVPIIKIEKLARIDPETDFQVENSLIKPQLNGLINHNGQKEHKLKIQEKNVKVQKVEKVEKVEKFDLSDEKLLKLFEKQSGEIRQQQVRLYQQFIQIWLLKVSAKLTKLSDWQKSTNWFASRLIDDQRNNLAETLKNKN